MLSKEQAIEFLKEYTETNFSERCRDAHNMAIESLEQQPSEDCVSRQAVVEYIKACGAELGHDCENEIVVEDILNMPPVTPTHGTCKDCKHWKDSDGVYRRGIGAESKCPVNNSRVFEGTFCCADFEKRGNEND